MGCGPPGQQGSLNCCNRSTAPLHRSKQHPLFKMSTQKEPVDVNGDIPCLVIAGPSGVGKGTVINQLKARHPGVFGFSVSHATRNPRPGEVDGVNYHFVSVEIFEELIAANSFLEHAKVHSNYYGTSFMSIKDVVSSGQLCILDIDVQGARSARKAGLKGTYVFFTPPSMAELERRLRGRGTETEASLQERLANCADEMASSSEVIDGVKLFDEVICNNVLEETIASVEKLIKPQLAKVYELRRREEAEKKKKAASEAAQTPKSRAAVAAGKTKTFKEEVKIGWMVSFAHCGVVPD